VSEAIDTSLKRIVQCLLSLSDAEKFVVRVDGRPVIHPRMQSLFNVKFAADIDCSLYEVVMTHALAAEKLGPGGFTRTLELVLKKFAKSEDECLQQFTAISRVPSELQLMDLVQRHSARGGVKISAMLRRALELGGFGGRIIIEKTSSSVPSVELVRGYAFELQQLLPIDVNFTSSRVTCIDGHIENVSEIHHLLEAASSAKEPCIIFVRGISDDVKHTLKVNYDRGSLRVLPVGVRFDLEGMNTLIDISIVSGCDLVSSLKGDLISSIKFNELPYVDQVTIFRGRTLVTNVNTSHRVQAHVNELRLRRAKQNVDDVGVLLDKRIKSLSPNHVVIRLPDDKDLVTNSQAIDYALRALKSAVDHGVTPEGELVATEYAAQVHSSRCFNTLRQLGAFVPHSLL
jgi:chaperonin GroEL (HSP60 family)